jgi:hypothetical protein
MDVKTNEWVRNIQVFQLVVPCGLVIIVSGVPIELAASILSI